MTLSSNELHDLAKDMTRRSFDDERRTLPAPSLANFSKFEPHNAPDTFVSLFESEMKLHGMNNDKKKFEYLPLVMSPKAKWIAP